MNEEESHWLQTRLTVQVGITGHRDIVAADHPRVLEQLQQVLRIIKEKTAALHREHRAFYQAYDNGQDYRLRLISSLAEGADRMAAHEALAQGYELQCPLPFERRFYETTFQNTEESRREFRDLLQRATSVFEISAANQQFVSRAYDDAGRIVIDHSDLLIALWDGAPGSYIAGTYATIEVAARQHIPIIIIPVTRETATSDTPEATTLIRYREDHTETTDWQAHVERRLQQILLPHDQVGNLMPKKNRILFPLPPKVRFQGIVRPWQSRLEQALLLPFRRTGSAVTPLPVPECDVKEDGAARRMGTDKWLEIEENFSHLSGGYATRHRNNKLGRQFFPFLATVFLTLALYCYPEILPLRITFYGLQILCLGFALFAVHRDRISQHHRRFFSYRIVAERCRQTIFLWPMGFCNVRYRHRSYLHNASRSEMAWFYRMLVREKGLPNAEITQNTIRDWLAWLQQDFIRDQYNYQANRAARCSLLRTRVGKIAVCLFWAGIAATLCRTICSLPDTTSNIWMIVSTVLALIFPSAAVFFSSFAKISDYPEHYKAAHNMQETLTALAEDVHALQQRPEKELSFDAVRNLCEAVDASCMDELSDWENTIQSSNVKWI